MERKRRAAQLSHKDNEDPKDLRPNLKHAKTKRTRKRYAKFQTLPNAPQGTLGVEGYQHFRAAVAPTAKLWALVHAACRDMWVVFNHNARTDTNDEQRCQAQVHVTEEVLPGITAVLERFERRGLQRSGFVALRSFPGCQEQAAHQDFDTDLPCFARAHVPLGVLVALQECTTLDVWPGSHTATRTAERLKPIVRHQIALGKGDVLIFRGDLVHAGSAYSRPNVRLHCYLDAEGEGEPRKPNVTWELAHHNINPL